MNASDPLEVVTQEQQDLHVEAVACNGLSSHYFKRREYSSKIESKLAQSIPFFAIYASALSDIFLTMIALATT